MTHRWQLIVFDWDGTLMDSEARIVTSFNAALGDVGHPTVPRAAVQDIIGLALGEAIAHLVPAADAADQRQIAERYRHHFMYASTIPAPLFPGAREVLEELRATGLLLAVATGKGRRGLNHAMDEVGCTHFFHTSRCADETLSKPHPQMLLEIMEVLDVAPAATLMVGDTTYDMEMAQRANTPALAVSYGVHTPERLLTHGPLACVDDIRAVRDWILQGAVA